MRLLNCRYNGSRLADSRPFGRGELRMGKSRWSNEIRTTSDADPTALTLDLEFRLAEGFATSSGVAVAFDFTDWLTDNYVLAPACLYNGNRYRVLAYRYPPYIYDEKLRPLDMPVSITNVPHLNLDKSPAKVELLTGNCSTPLLSFFDPKAKRGWIMLTRQCTPYGNSGLFVEENVTRGLASFVVSAPGVRERRYVMTGFAASGDQGADWKPGDEVALQFRLYNFSAADIPAFLAKVFDVRKVLSGRTQYRNVAPYSATANVIAKHHDAAKWFESDTFGYICNSPSDNNPFGHIQVGWNGIPIYCHPEVILETPERLRRVSRSMDAVSQNMRGKSGLLYAMFRHGELLGDTFSQMTQKRSIAMVRRSGETLYCAIQQFELLRRNGHGDMVKPEWDAMLRGIADGLVGLWVQYGQFGQFVDVETGKIEINGSTAGAINISALALASRYFHEREYFEVAEVAGDLYYERDLCKGYAGGGPAEILQCPDSESAYNLVEAYVVLYELSGKQQWLKRACDAAHLLATWIVSYDYQFPEGCDMDRVGARSTGAVFASVQNQHGAPGLYISSGDFLLKLYRATGNRRYAELYKDTVHNAIQYVTTPINPLGRESPAGSVSERVNLSDWEGREHIGMVTPGDSNLAWETLVELTCLQTPGIYLRTDADDFFVFDHVEAQIIERGGGAVILRITNPTTLPASVSILAESAGEVKRPLGWNAFLNWPKVDVEPGQTREVKIPTET